MIDDKRFIDRIARALYAKMISTSSENTAWLFLEENEKIFWKCEAERFIEAANDAGIALYDMDDHR